MTDPREPIRLVASADTDPMLRDALRVIHGDAPSMAALTALADKAERTLHEGGAAQTAATQASAHAYPLLTKLAIAGVVAGALVYAGLQRARVDRHAPPEEPTQTRAPAVVPLHAAHARALDAVRADDATQRAHGAAEQAPDTHGAAGTRVERAPQPALGSPRAPSSESDAPPGNGEFAPQQGQTARGGQGDSRSAKRPATATAPRRAAADQKRQALQDQGPASPRAEREIELLESAQRALQREPRRALELLEQHRSAFPRGAFAQERDVLILEAFQRLHDAASLRQGARAFMQRYPRSPHRARVEKLVEDLR